MVAIDRTRNQLRASVLLTGPHVDGQKEILRALEFEADDRGWPATAEGEEPSNRVFRGTSGWSLVVQVPEPVALEDDGMRWAQWFLAGFENPSLLGSDPELLASLDGLLFVTSADPAIRATEDHCLALLEGQLARVGRAPLPGRTLRDLDPALVGEAGSRPEPDPRGPYPERPVALLTGQGVVAAFNELQSEIRGAFLRRQG